MYPIRKMKYLLTICIVAMALSGCAGILDPFISNKYSGTYDGTFTTSDGRAGTTSIQLTNIGNIFGTLTDSSTGASGSLTGSVNANLWFSGTAGFPSSASHGVSGTFTTPNNQVIGTLKGTGYTVTLDMTNKVGVTLTGAGSPGTAFAGTYSGTYSNSSKDKGNASVTISSTGQITGTLNDLTTGQTGSVAGTIYSNGSVTGSVTFALTQTFNTTGSLKLSSTGALTGRLTSVLGSVFEQLELTKTNEAPTSAPRTVAP